MRRVSDWTGWDDYSDDINNIDLLQGRRKDNATISDWNSYYYYFLDIEIGTAEKRVQSPLFRRFDVDKIYMRPRDPAMEFDVVSTRALWVDTL